jgi:hypothetical protein
MRNSSTNCFNRFPSLAALALGGVLFAQNAPDKSADNTAGRSAEPVYRVGKGVSPPRPIDTPSPEISQRRFHWWNSTSKVSAKNCKVCGVFIEAETS